MLTKVNLTEDVERLIKEEKGVKKLSKNINKKTESATSRKFKENEVVVFFIGGQKCGSTTLAYSLKRDPKDQSKCSIDPLLCTRQLRQFDKNGAFMGNY